MFKTLYFGYISIDVQNDAVIRQDLLGEILGK